MKKTYYQYLINLPILKIGVKKHTELALEKRILLVNSMCFLTLISFIIIVAVGVFFDSKLITSTSLIGYFIAACLIITSLTLQYLGQYNEAKTLFVLTSFFTCALFHLYIRPYTQVEYYYIIPPIMSIAIFNSKWPPIIFLFLGIFLFFDILYLKRSIDFERFHFLGWFFAIFSVVYFFKKINLKNEAKLKKQQLELENLHEFKNYFFVNLSHEIRTPLTLIKGYSSKINLKDSEIENEKKIAVINNQVVHIQNIIDNILDLSKLDTNKLEITLVPVDIIPFLTKHYLDFKELFLKKGIDISLVIDIPNMVVNMDEDLLSKSINNLLSNALKFTPNKGKVSLVTNYKNGLEISIIDNGIGIPDYDIDKVFNRFYQSKNHITESQGSGIGLSFSKSILDAHGFQLNGKSSPNIATVFSILIPEKDVLISKNVEPSKTTSTKPTRLKNLVKTPRTIANEKRHILIVEDHDEMRLYLKTVLSTFKITEACNGKEALKILENNSFDAIITDYMMPYMDGVMFVAEIKKQNLKTPVIVLTARQDHQGKLNMLRLGIDSYLTKPFVEEELIINLNRAIVYYDNIKDFESDLDTDEKIYLNDTAHLISTKINHFIEENIKNKNFGVEDLAIYMNLSRSSLHRKLKFIFGQTPNQIIIEARLQKAKILLEENPSPSKKALAEAVGVYNASYFYKKLEERFTILKVDA